MVKGCDVLVIGGGMAGVSAAAAMAADADVIVLEAEKALGTQSTGRSAALYIENYGNATLRALNRAALKVFDDPSELSDHPILTPRGLLFAARDDEMSALEAYVLGSCGVDRISPAEAVELVPILRGDRIAAALYEPHARDIDVDGLLQGYKRLGTRHGCTFETGAPVQSIERKADLWQVETAKGGFAARVVVNAAGAWADEVARMAGVTPVGLTPCRRSGAMIPAPDGHDITRWPLFASMSEEWYAKPMGGSLFVSPADEDPVAACDITPDDMVLAEGLDRYAQAVTAPLRRVTHSWAGLRTFAPDRTPVVGFDPEAEGFFWLAGQGGYGIQTAPALAPLAAALVGERVPDLEPEVVSALAPGRATLR